MKKEQKNKEAFRILRNHLVMSTLIFVNDDDLFK